MARRPPSARSLSTGDDTTLRRTSTEVANPNVFSDEYALDLADSINDLSPTDSLESRPEHLTLGRGDNVQSAPREYLPLGLPGKLLGLNDLSTGREAQADASADPHRTPSISRSIADSQRTLSTSSRFSMPRAPSPYRGPTAPSQPYGLYSQVTRASSIASESTIRPAERPFIPQGGPEHPYSMYPQNTVPEEDDDPEAHLGLGFPGLTQAFQPGTVAPGNDTGDIVGTDGHIEQLPPYSRYADNVIAKGDMARIDTGGGVSADPTLETSLQPGASSASDVELTAVGPELSATEVARKEGLTEDKKMRRTCFGMPLWTMLILIAVVVLAAVLGGVIGGVVGNKKGADRAFA